MNSLSRKIKKKKKKKKKNDPKLCAAKEVVERCRNSLK